MSWRSMDTPPPPALGMLELSSVALGFEATDRMLKIADVDLVLSRTICSGKYMVVVGGELTEVETSVAMGREVAGAATVDHFVIPNVHPDVFPALSSATPLSDRGALGIIESFSVASLVEAIDAVAKAAQVAVTECRLAMALGGKAYLVFTGTVQDVEYAIEAGAEVVSRRGLLVHKVVIPDPRPELFDNLV